MNLQTRIGRLESYLAPPQNADKAAVRATIVDLLENHSDCTEGLRAAAVAADCDPTLESLVAERQTPVIDGTCQSAKHRIES